MSRTIAWALLFVSGLFKMGWVGAGDHSAGQLADQGTDQSRALCLYCASACWHTGLKLSSGYPKRRPLLELTEESNPASAL